jgi:anti-sigma factor ChrR (cupin superfamily)
MNRTHGILDNDTESLGQSHSHPSLETLDAYHRGVLRKNEAAEIRRHLVLCRECSETLLDLAQFLEESPEPSRLWSAELTAAWEEWLAALKERETIESQAPEEARELVAR